MLECAMRLARSCELTGMGAFGVERAATEANLRPACTVEFCMALARRVFMVVLKRWFL
jgi:hypothetical protein